MLEISNGLRVSARDDVPRDVIDRAIAAHRADGRSRTVSVRRPEHHPATLYRTLKPGAELRWSREYDDRGECVASSPVLRHGVPAWDYRVPAVDGRGSLREEFSMVECDPSEATMWFAPTVDWLYDQGADLRVRPQGPILGRQDFTPLVTITGEIEITSEGDGTTKGFLIE